MTFLTKKSLPRRTMLKGIGASVALPFSTPWSRRFRRSRSSRRLGLALYTRRTA